MDLTFAIGEMRRLMCIPAVQQKYDGQTDRRTDGHPKPIGSQPFGLGPNENEKNQFRYKLCVWQTAYSIQSVYVEDE